MGGCINMMFTDKEIKTIVENFHFLEDKKLIDYIENKYICKVVEGNKIKDYLKLNDSINLVSFI